MTQPESVTVAPGLLRLLRTLLVSNLLMVGSILVVSLSLIGMGTWTVVACAAVVALSTTLYLLAAIRYKEVIMSIQSRERGAGSRT